jgi:hypothetical protein
MWAKDMRALLESLGERPHGRLKELDFSRLDVDDEHADVLGFPHPVLGAAIASGCLPALAELNLTGTDIQAADMEWYASAIAGGRVPCLRVLDLTENYLGHEHARGLHLLLDALQGERAPANLLGLYLEGNDLGNAGAEVRPRLGRARGGTRQLRGVVVVQMLGKFIECPRMAGLVSLDLENNGIDADGFQALAPFLTSPRASHLQSLYLGNQPLGASSIMCLAEVIRDGRLPSLVRLFVVRRPCLTTLSSLGLL